MKSSAFHLLAIAIAVSVAHASPTPGMNSVLGSMMSAVGGSSYSSMLQAMIDYKMTESISPTGMMTLFLIRNEFYQNVMSSEMGRRMNSDPERMKRFLGRHMILQRKLMPSDISNEMVTTSASGDRLRFNIYGKLVTVNGMIMMEMEPQMSTPNIAVYRMGGVIKPSMGARMMDLLNMRNISLSTLIHAMQISGLADTLDQSGNPYTLFAPNNAAFRLMPDGALSKLMSSPADMKKFLLAHIVEGSYFTPGLMNGDLHAMDGSVIRINTMGNTVTVDGAHIVNDMSLMNAFSDNGVLQVVDHVLT